MRGESPPAAQCGGVGCGKLLMCRLASVGGMEALGGSGTWNGSGGGGPKGRGEGKDTKHGARMAPKGRPVEAAKRRA